MQMWEVPEQYVKHPMYTTISVVEPPGGSQLILQDEVVKKFNENMGEDVQIALGEHPDRLLQFVLYEEERFGAGFEDGLQATPIIYPY